MENLDYILEAERCLSEMRKMVRLYESERVNGTDTFWVDLTVAQVNQLKSAFVAKRTELIAAVNAVTG